MKTIDQIYAIEPRLRELFNSIPDIMANHAIAAVSSEWGRWSYIKKRLSQLVGFEGQASELCNADDYDTVFQAFLKEAERICPDPW